MAISDVLLKNHVYGAYVSKEFGGMGMNRKELLQLHETLARNDLGVFSSVCAEQVAVMALEHFGTPDQKDKYLAKLASGQLRAAVAFSEST